ncbi:cytochrome P450 [Artemisia annua]|uniref:Cytochrome P450 n=1 Tax=Artemisia annua TaxID=35608 RepID=A0A2U1M0C2_ARTAN|nr:cytochrome P450 [Artemisia annua]
MENLAFCMEKSFLSSLLLILTPFFLLFITKKFNKTKRNLPPGPRPLPIIGNMHQMGNKPHVSTAMLAQEYGPLISLRLGSRLLVVASSPEAAMEVLKTQDRNLSGRNTPDALQQSFMDYYMVWAYDCSQHWKSLRTLSKAQMFSPKALEAQSKLRNEKMAQMLDFLNSNQGKVVKIEEVVFTTLFNTMSNILFSKDFLDLNDEHGTAHWLKVALQKTLESGIKLNVSDLFPVISGLDLQGLRRDYLKHLHEVSSFTDTIIDERRDQIASSAMTKVAVEEKDFLDRLLENNFTNTQINIVALVSQSFVTIHQGRIYMLDRVCTCIPCEFFGLV